MSNILTDPKPTGKGQQPWKMNKLSSLLVAQAYYEAGFERYFERVSACSDFLQFNNLTDGSKRLKRGSFCHVRLCPMCAWRRSKLSAVTVHKIVQELYEREPSSRLLFLTLTVPNCTGEKLPENIDWLMAGWKKLLKRRGVKRVLKGGFRQLEITRNRNKKSKHYGTYHPHFHALLVVDESYFRAENPDYITQMMWAEMWAESIGTKEKRIVDIRVVKPDQIPKADFQETVERDRKKVFKTAKAVREVAKYLTDYKWLKKATLREQEALLDSVVDGNENEDYRWIKSTVPVLHGAVYGRRLQTFFGNLRDLKIELNLKSAEDATEQDLVTAGDDEIKREDVVATQVYSWCYKTFDYFSDPKLQPPAEAQNSPSQKSVKGYSKEFGVYEQLTF